MLDKLAERAREGLRAREKARDEVLGRARRARMLSKQSILQTHNKSSGEAASSLGEAQQLLDEMKTYFDENPELEFYDETASAMEEYAEASILSGLLAEGAYPSPEELGVPLNRYIMGLCDVPGELRREALDALREGDMGLAEAHLGRMEEIYLSLVSMAEASLLLKGLRRKLDIARGVIERTRGEITAEAGRRRLSESVKRLTDKLGGA